MSGKKEVVVNWKPKVYAFRAFHLYTHSRAGACILPICTWA